MTEKNKKFASVIRRITPLYFILTLLVAAGYFFAVFYSFDDVLGHFDPTVWFWAMAGLIVLAGIWSFVFACPAINRLSVPKIPEADPLEYFATALAAVMAGAIAVSTALRVIRDPVKPALPALSAVLFACLAVALVLSLIPGCRTGLCRTVFLLLGTLAVILSLFILYFSDISINSPIRHISMLTIAFPLLFLISECRLAFVTEEDPVSRRSTGFFYLLSSGLTVSVSAGLALGTAFSRIFGLIDEDPSLTYLPLTLYFALGLIALSRLAAFEKAADIYIDPDKDKKAGKEKKDAE